MKKFFALMAFVCILLGVGLTCAFLFVPAAAAIGSGSLSLLYVPIIGLTIMFACMTYYHRER